MHAFVNRTDELGQLNAVLTGRDGGRLVVSVHVVAGTAGAGKTSLVLHWAHQVKDRFPDGQLFVNFRGYDPREPVTAEQALRGFLRALGVASGDVPQDVDDAAAALAGLPLSRTRQLLDDLVGAHLLEQSGPDRFQFHDLLRAHASDQAHDEEPAAEREAALRRALDWYLHTADAAQTWLQPGEDHLPLPGTTAPLPPLSFTDYDAAADWAERERAAFPHLVRAAATAGLHQHAWQLTATLWNALSASAAFADWLDFAPAGLASAEHTNDTNGQLLLLNQLGMSHRSVDQLDQAVDYLGRALTLARTAGNRTEEAHALNLLGLIHLRTRRLEAAAAHFAQSIGLFREVSGDRWAASALSNLAGAHLEAGRLREAEAAVQEAPPPDPRRSPRPLGRVPDPPDALHRPPSRIPPLPPGKAAHRNRRLITFPSLARAHSPPLLRGYATPASITLPNSDRGLKSMW